MLDRQILQPRFAQLVRCVRLGTPRRRRPLAEGWRLCAVAASPSAQPSVCSFRCASRRCPFGNCFLSPERYLIIINYVAMGQRASSSAVKGLRLSHDLEKGKRKSLVCYNSSHLWVPSSPLEHLFFLFYFFMFSLFSIERVFVFQLDQRRSATDRRFDRSTNRTQSKGGKVFPWVRQLENWLSLIVWPDSGQGDATQDA